MNPFEGIEIDLWKNLLSIILIPMKAIIVFVVKYYKNNIFPPFAAVLLMRETSLILLPGMIWWKAGWLKW